MVYPRQGGANRVPLIHREAYSLARGHTLLGTTLVRWAHNTVAVARGESGVLWNFSLRAGSHAPRPHCTPERVLWVKKGMPAWPLSSPNLSGSSFPIWPLGTAPQTFYWLWVGLAVLLGFALGRLRPPRIQGGPEGVRQSVPASCEVCRRASKAAAAFRLADRRSGGLSVAVDSGCVGGILETGSLSTSGRSHTASAQESAPCYER